MKRWNTKSKDNKENLKIDRFLADIIAVCQKHGYSIGHEDCHGGFQIVKLDERYQKWLMSASDATEK